MASRDSTRLTKICSKCKIEKPFSEYTRRKERPGQVIAMCKRCHNEMQKSEVPEAHGRPWASDQEDSGDTFRS